MTSTWRWPRADPKPHERAALAAELTARYGPALFHYARRHVGSDADAEDIVAETLAAGLSARKSPPTDDSPGDDPTRAYLFGIARRKIASVLRGRTRRPEEPLSDALLSESPSPEGVALESERREAVRALLATLPNEWREVLLFKYVEQLSQAEIAITLNRSEAAINSLLQRARAAARERGAHLFIENEETDHVQR